MGHKKKKKRNKLNRIHHLLFFPVYNVNVTVTPVSLIYLSLSLSHLLYTTSIEKVETRHSSNINKTQNFPSLVNSDYPSNISCSISRNKKKNRYLKISNTEFILKNRVMVFRIPASGATKYGRVCVWVGYRTPERSPAGATRLPHKNLVVWYCELALSRCWLVPPQKRYMVTYYTRTNSRQCPTIPSVSSRLD